MHLYVGNATRQFIDFAYSVPIADRLVPRIQRINIGGQVKISGDLDKATVDRIIGQHIVYGMRSIDEATAARGFVGTCYSIDKPIPAVRLTHLMQRNEMALKERGREIRATAAIASNDALETNLVESARPERLNAFQTEVLEQNHDERNEEPALAEGIRVVRGEKPEPPRSRGRRRAA